MNSKCAQTLFQGEACYFLHEPALADARLSRDQGHSALARSRLGCTSCQPAVVSLSTDKGGAP